jgi:hypothetical protein
VLTVAVPEFAGTQDGTLHFQYLRWENGGNVRVASSFDEHLEQLAAIADSDRPHVEAFSQMFLRPHGTAAAPLVADALERLAAMPRRPRPQPTLATRILRPILRALVGAHSALNR